MNSNPKKRRQIDINTKLEILNAADQGEKKCDIANRFGIPASTLSTIISNRVQIENNTALVGTNRKRVKVCKNEDLDKKLFDWLMEARASNINVSGPILQEKARQEALRMGVENFQASNGWLSKFKSRWNLTTLKVCGEEAGVDPKILDSWQPKLEVLCAGYCAKDIFNADEAGLFFNMVPDKTLSLKGQACHGGKRSKERCTVLFCANSDGTEKLPPLVIGKYAKPRCFKNVKKLPCIYKNNGNSWMTASVFQEWLFSIDARMGVANRKILLFLDQCTAHKLPEPKRLRNVKVQFFPANCTSKLQPLDQGVICQVKRLYRHQLVLYLLREMSCKKDVKTAKWNILQAMHRICQAWNTVTPTNIAKCFKKAGFPVVCDTNEEIPEEWCEVTMTLGCEVSFEDFVECDSALAVCPSTEDQCDIRTSTEEETTVRCSEEHESTPPTDEDEEIRRPSTAEVTSALTTLEKLFLLSDRVEENMRIFNQLEVLVQTELGKKSKQTKILDFFKK